MDKPQRKKINLNVGDCSQCGKNFNAGSLGYNSACDDWEKYLEEREKEIRELKEELEICRSINAQLKSQIRYQLKKR